MKKTLSWVTLLCLLPALSAIGQSSKGDEQPHAYECTQLSIDEIDETLLTKAERLAMMERSLKKSMDRYESCVSQVQKNMASQGGGSGSGAGDGSEGAEGQGSANGNAQEAEQTNTTEPTNTSAEVLTPSKQQTPVDRKVVKPKDNDSIICKLLWDEIQKAPADKLAGFEKQYKDYNCG